MYQTEEEAIEAAKNFFKLRQGSDDLRESLEETVKEGESYEDWQKRMANDPLVFAEALDTLNSKLLLFQ
jgi:hypothetical protein